MERIKFDHIGAFKAGEKRHPDDVISSLGCKIIYSEPQPIADLTFYLVDVLPSALPIFVTLASSYRFSEEMEFEKKGYHWPPQQIIGTGQKAV